MKRCFSLRARADASLLERIDQMYSKWNAIGRLVSEKSRFLMTKEQKIGDCTKASLFTVLYYHSASSKKKLDPFHYEHFKRYFKDTILEKKAVCLFHHSICLPRGDHHTFLMLKSEESWKKFMRKFHRPCPYSCEEGS